MINQLQLGKDIFDMVLEVRGSDLLRVTYYLPDVEAEQVVVMAELSPDGNLINFPDELMDAFNTVYEQQGIAHMLQVRKEVETEHLVTSDDLTFSKTY